jgi:hypothetical protein
MYLDIFLFLNEGSSYVLVRAYTHLNKWMKSSPYCRIFVAAHTKVLRSLSWRRHRLTLEQVLDREWNQSRGYPSSQAW